MSVRRRVEVGMPLVVPAVVALLLGRWGIHRGLWRDESVTYEVAHRSTSDIWRLLHNIDAVHGLYYLLMHAVFSVWDGGAFALRLPSVLAMAVAAALVAATARELAGPRFGLVAGTVFALMPTVQNYSQEGRSYALVCACIAGMTYLLVRQLSRPDVRVMRWIVLYTLLGVLASWLNEFAVIVLAAHAVTVWLVKPHRSISRALAVSATVIVVLLLPLAAISSGQAGKQLNWLGSPTFDNYVLYVVSAAICVVGALYAPARPPGVCSLGMLVVPLWVVPTGILFAVSVLVKPFYVERYVLYSHIALALAATAIGTAIWRSAARVIASRGWSRPRVTGARVLVAAVAVVLVVVPLAPLSRHERSANSRKDNSTGLANAAAALAVPGEAVVFIPARRREWLLSSPKVLHRLDDIALESGPAASATLQGEEKDAATIAKEIRAQQRILLVRDKYLYDKSLTTVDATKRAAIRRYFKTCAEQDARGGRVIQYVRRGTSCSPTP